MIPHVQLFMLLNHFTLQKIIDQAQKRGDKVFHI